MRRSTTAALALVAGFFAAPTAWAGGPEPVDLVEEIYATYMSASAMPKPAFDLPIYSERLTGMIETFVQTEPEDEVGAIDFDIFLYAQDYALEKLSVTEGKREAGAAEVTATFVNLDQPTTVVFDFVEEKGRWKVDDIAWPDGGERLSGLLAAGE